MMNEVVSVNNDAIPADIKEKLDKCNELIAECKALEQKSLAVSLPTA